MPAEWEVDGAILVAWPHDETDWNYMRAEVVDCYIRMIEAFAKDSRVIVVAPNIEEPRTRLAAIPEERIKIVELPTNDTWTRDYGPLAVESSNGIIGCDFKFNGWGLKFAADKDNLVTSGLYRQGVLRGLYMNCLSFVLEGGAVETDGNGTLLTTSRCLLSPNRNGANSREQIEEFLSQTLGFTVFHWLEHGSLAGDDTDSHVDTLARFAPDNTILYTSCRNADDVNYDDLAEMEKEILSLVSPEGTHYKTLPLVIPDPIFDEDNRQLPATYANYLVTPRSVFMPTYGQPHFDEMAHQTLVQAFPGRQIVDIDCRALIKQHGSLHCATMQIPSEIISFNS